jgi:hypothetical protein
MIRSLRILLPLLGVLACLAGPGSAAASNVLTNPGFEIPCPGASCGWTPVAPATVATDSSTFYSGGSSLKVSVPAQGSVAGVSTCVALSPGPHTASFWYLRPDANATSLGMEFAYYSQAGCSSGLIGTGKMFGTTIGAWTESTDTVTIPAGTVSAQVSLVYSCTAVAPASCTANFDETLLTPESTTAARIRSFTSSRSPAGTLLRWRTAGETEVAGFNLYRVANGRRTKISKRLIAAKGKGGGASYRFLDGGHRGASYRLEVVNLDGTRQWRTAH